MVAFPLVMLVTYGNLADPQGYGRLAGISLFADNFITWFKDYNVAIPFSSHLWTLSFEFQVYLVIPFVFFVLHSVGQNRFIAGLLGFLAFAFLLRLTFTFLIAPHPIVWVTPFLRPESILFGILLSLGAFSKLPTWATGLCIVASGIAFFTVPFPVYSVGGAALSYPLAAVMCTSLVHLALRWDPLSRVLSWGPIRFLGSISFGLYVFHFLGIYLTGIILAKFGITLQFNTQLFHWIAQIGAVTLVTTVLATASYFGFERPFLLLKDRFTIVRGR